MERGIGLNLPACNILQTRENFTYLINQKGYKTGAEIGVRRGWFSELILKRSKIEKWYCIDTWELFRDKTASGSQDYDRQHAENLLKQYIENGRCNLIQNYSLAAARKFDDCSLDFAYIDADHEYESVKQDLLAWYPKIRERGIIAGHDFDKQEWPGVYNAVNEFFSLSQIYITGVGSSYGDDGGDGNRPSWFIIK